MTDNLVHRPLGALEELFFLMNEASPANCSVSAEVCGPATVQGWRAAFKAVKNRHPLWSVCIRRDENGIPTFAQANADAMPLRIVEGATPFDWQAELLRELQTPFDVEEGPLIRAILHVRDQTGIVVLTAHHSIADGLSLAFAIRDLLQFMSSGNVPERLPAMEELIAKAHLAAFTCVNRRMPNARLPYQSWDPRDTSNRVAFQTAAIPPAVLSGWRAACRKAKTTMNAALCTALVRASREISPQLADRTCSLVSPVSRREALGVGDQCGLFLGWGAGEFR